MKAVQTNMEALIERITALEEQLLGQIDIISARQFILEDRVAVLEEYHKGVTAIIAGDDLTLENEVTVNDIDLEITGNNAKVVDGNLIIN